jgi:hypothetical protein
MAAHMQTPGLVVQLLLITGHSRYCSHRTAAQMQHTLVFLCTHMCCQHFLLNDLT